MTGPTPDESAPVLLVTGANGFLGQRIVEALPAGKFRVVGTGRGATWSGPGLWQRADLLDPTQRAALIRSVRPDLLLHCAWETRHGYADTAPENLDWVSASLDLLRLFAAEGGRRAILIGSGAECVSPPTLLGQARLALTDTALAAAGSLGIELLVARLFHLFGPGDRTSRLPMAALDALRNGRPFELRTPDTRLDYLDVRDAAAALALLIDAPATGVLNVASGRAVSVRSLVEAIATRLGRVDLVTVAPPVAVATPSYPLPDGPPAPTSLEKTVADLVAQGAPAVRVAPAMPSADEGIPEASRPEYQPIGRALAAGQFAQAEQLALQLLQTMPDNQLLRNMLALAIRQQGRAQEARTMLEDIVVRAPSLSPARANLATLLLALGDLAAALPQFEAAHALQPRERSFRAPLLKLLVNAGRLEEADAIIEKILAAYEPAEDERVALLADRARLRVRWNRFHEALDFVEQSLAVRATSPAALLKALVLQRLGRTQEMAAQMQLACERWPNEAGPQIAWAQYQFSRGDYRASNETLRALLQRHPDNEEATAKLINSLQASRHDNEGAHIDDSATLARGALQRFVIEKRSRQQRTLAVLQYAFQRVFDEESMFRLEREIGTWRRLLDLSLEANDPYAFGQQIPRLETMEDRRVFLAAHVAWGERLEAGIKPVTPPRRVRGPADRLRVGLLSADLRHHPVSFFALPLIERHDRSKLDLFAYTSNPGDMDAIQQKISQLIPMRRSADLSDDALAQQIVDDRIDVLLDLSGMTLHGRPDVLARKPAPVQASWVGYVHSMGMSRIEYLVTDPYLEPPDLTLITEKPLQLPGSYYAIDWLGFPEVPIDAEPAQLRRGKVTFGITNNPMKYSARSIALWARAALSVPGSRILFLRPEGNSALFRQGITTAFAQHGVDASRLDFIATRSNHLQYYNEIDVSLDSMPRTGGTTTCESIWMGVPMVTLVGAAQYERLSNSVLQNAGLGELCAPDPESYVETARRIATDVAWLREFRRTIRARIRANPLGQPQRFADDFATLLRGVA